MQRIAYFSSAATDGPAELSAILESSRRNNAALGVTGLLCHHDGSFLQFLEGDAGVLEALYGRIRRDRRHKDLVRILDEQAATRAFGDWSMALVDAGEAGTAHQAFCQGLKDVVIAPGPEAAQLHVVLNSFRRWLR